MGEEGFKPFRKLFRLVGLAFPLLYLWSSRERALGFTAIVLLLLLLLEWIRFRALVVNEFLFRNVSMILRDREKHELSAITWFVIASLLTILLFGRGIAVAALLFSLVGDMAAEIVGIRYGRTKVFGKSLEGSLACLVSCLVIGLGSSSLLQLPLLISLIGASAATAVELLPLPLDDNLTMPLLAGAIMATAQLFIL